MGLEEMIETSETQVRIVTADSDIRESMASLASWLPAPLRRLLQWFLTWLTGHPLRGQTAIVRLRPLHHLFLTLLVLCVGVAISVYSVSRGGAFLLLLPVSLVLTISGQRKLFLSIEHATLHGTLVRSQRLGKLIGEAITIAIFTPSWNYLYVAHVGKHHSKSFCSLEDPDAGALYAFGIRPGRSREQLWRRFLATMVSPRFHGQYAWLRLQENLRPSSPVRLGIVLGLLASIAVFVQLYGAWPEFLVAWALPLLPGFHLASLVNFAGEHRWFSEPQPDGDRHTWYMERTHGRFTGERPPDRGLPAPRRWLAWAGWWIKMLCWHLPLRLMVVPADMPAHDHHHMNVKGDWSNAVYDRQRALEAGAPYTETWGLFRSIDLFFDELSRCQPLEREPTQESSLVLMDM
jgi:hypothetical protein